MDTEVALRLFAAAGLALVIGMEREVSGQEAGLRTHITVAVGAALFGLVSALGFTEFAQARNNTNINVDVERVASNIVVGIGFLGAGLIHRQRGSVRGLTTAASLWVTAAIGLACGVGWQGAAALSTLILLATLVVLRPLRAWVRRHLARPSYTFELVMAPKADPQALIGRLSALEGASVSVASLGREADVYTIAGRIRLARHAEASRVFATIARLPDVARLPPPVDD
jgi:putative Mg2+ transporter-C (MgtC) family protein